VNYGWHILQQQQQQPSPPTARAELGLVACWLLVPAATRTGLSLSSRGSIPDTALCEVSATHIMTLTPTPTSHILFASPPPFKPHTPRSLLQPLSRWYLSSFYDSDNTPYHLHWCLPNRADSAACARFWLCKKDLCTLQSTQSALTLSLATTLSVLLQMSKSLAGLSHDIQTVAHASSPFSTMIALTSILPLTTHPVISGNASFSLKRHRAPSPLHTLPVRPTTCSWITWSLILDKEIEWTLCMVEHIQYWWTFFFLNSPYLGLSRLTF
jgi:hypothetical protein